MRFAPTLVLALAAVATGCATTRTHVAPIAREELLEPGASVETPVYQVFLLGDVGAGDPEDAEPALTALSARLREAGAAASVVFLGDQLPSGLPDSGAAARAGAEERLRRLARAVEGFDGGVYLVAGERDWEGGADAVRRQEAFVEGILGRDDAFLPGGAAGGPTVIELDGGPVLVGIDTPWWFQPPDARPQDSDISVPGDVLRALEDILAEYDEDNVLVVGHHPIRSGGPRAGVYPLSTYLLPPILGAAVPLYRSFIGGPNDLASSDYRAFRAAMETVLRTHDGAVYAAAHERTLEAHRVQGVATRRHFLVSGAASDADPVSPGNALFSSGRRGFLVLRYADDGSVALETVDVSAPGAAGEIVAALRGSIASEIDSDVPESVDPADLPRILGQVVTAAADSSFLKSPTHEFFFGRGYREAWAAPVDVPVLDVGTDYGGLTPVEQGGGLQSTSIRFAAGDGHTYQVRLLRKRAAESLPPELQTEIVRGVVHDQTSATIPYGALAAARLLEAAGVLHAEPRIVYVPDDPRLGRFRDALANQLALIEIRPNDDMSDRPEFGRSDDVVSSAKLDEEMREDHDHDVDGPAFLRARLMDLLMGDWDRHADQWRWAGFDPGLRDPSLTGEDATRGKIYVPIPRDRDFAFYRIGGLFPGLVKYFQPKLQNYEEDFGDIRGLTYSGIPLDRRYLSELEWPDWQEAVADLQRALTDEVVAGAFAAWPPAVHAHYSAEAVADFLARRERLPRVAERYYRMLAQAPDVMGSDEREHFTVFRDADGSARVTVRHASGDGEPGRTLFERTFKPGETREVRIWGLGGTDWLVVEGDGPPRVRVRFIGGAGDDVVRDLAGSGAVIYYDDARGNDVAQSDAVTLRLTEDPRVNRYEPLDYERYAVRSFYPQVAYDRTDGALVGLGIVSTRPRFRGRHIVRDLSARVGTSTGALEGRYAFRDADRWGRGHGVVLDVRAATPRNVRNFFGFGNDTESPLPDDLYRVQIARVRAEADYVHRIADAIELRVGPALSYADVRTDSTGFVSLPAAGLDDAAFEPMLHAGAAAQLELARVDAALNPRQGLRWLTSVSGWAGVGEFAEPYGTVGSDLAFYVTPVHRPQVTIAARLGAVHAFGDVPLFDAPALGGSTLRGYLRERFTGNTAAFQSAELRVKLLTLSTALIPFEIGGIGFVDNGRVWADGVPTGSFLEDWHQGYGGGIWIGLVEQLLLSATIGTSREGSAFSVGLGFNY